jgi:predicted lipid-binding transport protein (Tim44 family)
MGGGKSVGMQRQSASADKAPGSTTTPAQAAPASAAAAPAAAGAAAAGTAAAASKRSWMGPLAGIAAGLGIAALASHLGFGEELASMLMMGLLAVAVLAAVGWFMRRRAAAGAGGMSRTAYAGAGAGAGGMPEPVQAFEAARPAQGGSLIGANLQPGAVAAIPSDFDVATFVRNAKVQFVRLQAAHDAGNLDDIRAFTTPEMFAEIRMDVSERGAAEQHTEVLQLDAEVLSVQEDGLLYVASVRFHGQLREERNGAPSDVDEVWHLTKPRAGSSGWVLAGIQQRG